MEQRRLWLLGAVDEGDFFENPAGNHDPAVPDAVYRPGRLAKVENLLVLGITHDVAVLFSGDGRTTIIPT
jgi:hypothetical protein